MKSAMELMEDHCDAITKQRDALAAEFKNFHRLLCERFGYVHDEVDWRRDQLSLIECIAAGAHVQQLEQDPLCAICDQIKELHPTTHPWTAGVSAASRASQLETQGKQV